MCTTCMAGGWRGMGGFPGTGDTHGWAATLWGLWEAAGALNCWVLSSAMGIFLDHLYCSLRNCSNSSLVPRHPPNCASQCWLFTWLWRSFFALCNPLICICFCFLWFEVIYNKSLHSPTTLSNLPLFSSSISWFCVLLLLSWFGDIVKDTV